MKDILSRIDPNAIMDQAIQLAKQAEFETDPNPMVGAVLITATGDILSQGYHLQAGQPHAEVNTLNHLFAIPEDAILFVTLEPCCFQGKTPACTDLIIKKKIKYVCVGCLDPNPLVSGKGVQQLLDAGIEVFTGIQEDKCIKLNKVFNKHIVQKKPYITIKAGTSLDGKIAMPSGESKWITHAESRAWGHRLRSQHQAIIVGSQTLIDDNPELTDRSSLTPKHPIRVVFSSRGLIPENSKFVTEEHSKRFLLAGKLIENKTVYFLEKSGIETIIADTIVPNIDWALEALYSHGICSALLEGGATLTSSFIKAKQIDQLYLFLSGKIIGTPQAPAWTGDLQISKLKETPEIHFENIEKIGEDILITGNFKHKI